MKQKIKYGNVYTDKSFSTAWGFWNIRYITRATIHGKYQYGFICIKLHKGPSKSYVAIEVKRNGSVVKKGSNV